MNQISRFFILGTTLGLFLATAIFAGYRPPPAMNRMTTDETLDFAQVPDSAPSNSIAAILARSPFDPDRGPFTRQADIVNTPVMDVRLAGIMGAGASRRANLVINGETRTVIAGDETPLGTVTAIEADAIIFADGRRVGLFE